MRILVAAGCVLLVLTIGFVLFLPKLTRKEPEHLGKPLSQWVEELRTDRFNWVTMQPVLNEEAAGAVRTIGESATPFLVSWVQKSQNSQKLYDLIDAFPIELSENRTASGRRGYQAILGLTVLGSNASAVMPVMTNLIFDESTALLAACVLASIGNAAVPVLSNALVSTNSKIRAAAAHSSGALGKTGAPLIPLLVSIFTNAGEDRVTRTSAARAVGMIGQEPEFVLPVLLTGLRDTDYIARRGAAFGLLLMGVDAAAVIPALESALKTPSGKLDQWILMALVGMNGDDLAVATALRKSFTYGVSNSPASETDKGLVVNREWARVFAAFRTITNITSQQLSVARKALVQIAPEEGLE